MVGAAKDGDGEEGSGRREEREDWRRRQERSLKTGVSTIDTHVTS